MGRVPAYTRFDVTAFYELGRPGLTIALAAQNLTDARYVTSGNGADLLRGTTAPAGLDPRRALLGGGRSIPAAPGARPAGVFRAA